jgi:hypothetical protein
VLVVKNILSWITNPKNFKFILIGIIVILGIFLQSSYNKLEEKEYEIERVRNNFEAKNDTIENLILKNGNVLGNMRSLIFTLEEYEKINKKYKDSLNLFKNQEPVVIIEYISSTEIEDEIENVVTKDSIKLNKIWDWGKSKQSLSIKTPYTITNGTLSVGLSQYKSTNNLWINNTLFKNEKNELFLNLQTDNPNVKFSNGNSILIDQKTRSGTKKQNFGLGLSFGFNLIPDSSNNLYRPYLLIGVNYTPQFLKF